MIPGGNAVAHDAVTHPRGGITNTIALFDTGTFNLTGKDVIFNIAEIIAKGTFTASFVNALFNTQLVMGSGSFLFTGFSLSLSFKWFLGTGNFFWTGFGTTPTSDRAFTFVRFITECHGGKAYTTRTEHIKHT